MRTVFFGTPELAVPALRALAEMTELVAVVCQPDRRAGRGLELRAPAVKLAAIALGVEVHQPVKVKTGNLHDWLAERRADVAVVLAYGRILPPPVLAAPRRGCMNLHASLLPKYRGAAPMQWAIVHGETETGISLMQMDEGLDTGPVYARRALAIGPAETAGELAERLSELAALVVRQELPRAVSGELLAVPQDERAASFAPPIERAHARIDWTRSARDVARLVRGMAPRPGAFTSLRGKTLRVLMAQPRVEAGAASVAFGAVTPGTVVLAEPGRIEVATGSGTLGIDRAQLEGRRELGAADLVNGRVLCEGDELGGALAGR